MRFCVKWLGTALGCCCVTRRVLSLGYGKPWVGVGCNVINGVLLCHPTHPVTHSNNVSKRTLDLKRSRLFKIYIFHVCQPLRHKFFWVSPITVTADFITRTETLQLSVATKFLLLFLSVIWKVIVSLSSTYFCLFCVWGRVINCLLPLALLGRSPTTSCHSDNIVSRTGREGKPQEEDKQKTFLLQIRVAGSS